MQKRQIWAPKLWLGADFFGWMRLLAQHRFAIGLSRLHWLVFITLFSFRNTSLRYIQELIWGRRVRETNVVDAPVFIIGHWRSGTTLLHELLALDPGFAYPTTYQCFFPSHFLLTEWHFTRLSRFALPSQRPGDNMTMGWDHPQEDEYALCNLGQPSPYLTIAFPKHGPRSREYFDLEELSPEALDRWKQCFLRFLKQITVRNPKPLVLKSPTHTYRIKVLLELFPNARFVHIVRNPYVVFPSSIHIWQSISWHQGLQRPTFEWLEEYVFDNFIYMFDKLEETRPLVDASRFYETRYEHLVKDPVGQLRAIYEHLDLGDFERVRPKVEQYMVDHTDYKTNHYLLTPELRDRITRRWGDVIRRYGYTCDDAMVPYRIRADRELDFADLQ